MIFPVMVSLARKVEWGAKGGSEGKRAPVQRTIAVLKCRSILHQFPIIHPCNYNHSSVSAYDAWDSVAHTSARSLKLYLKSHHLPDARACSESPEPHHTLTGKVGGGLQGVGLTRLQGIYYLDKILVGFLFSFSL